MAFIKNGLLFREVQPSDMAQLRSWRNDPRMSSGWFDPTSVQNPQRQEEWYASLGRLNQAYMAVREQETVGLLRFRLQTVPGEARLTGTDVSPQEQGRGFGKRILRSGAEYVLRDLGCNRCTAEALETNTAAIHIIRAAGFKPEGTLRDYVWRDGKWCNWHIFSLLRSEL